MTLSSGSRLAHYEITREIGRGGMGVVYLARDTKLDRDVAIKCLPEELSADVDRLARFEREAKTLASLNHPNIATVYGLEEVDGKIYLILEYLDGETLRGRFQREGVPWRKCLEMTTGIAEALAAAHAKGIVHRDIKPENVMLLRDGQVKVLDFGLARVDLPPEGSSADVATVDAHTEPGVVMGTAGYLSPEQVRGHASDSRSDIFSFGCVLYELLTGTRIFQRDTLADSLAATLTDDPPLFDDSNISVPSGVGRLVQRCLEKQPQQRFQSAGDLAYALREMLAESKPMVAPAASLPRRWGMIVVATCVLVVGIVAVTYLMQTSLNVTTERIDTLVVLPLKIDDAESHVAYLADEIPASIIDNLTTISALRVIPRETAYRYRNRSESAAAIGRDLDADYVLTGRILTQAGGVRIRAELIEVATNTQTWSQHFDRSLEDTAAVEKEITSRIVDSLRIRMTGEEQSRLDGRHPANPEAHAAYLEGRFWWNRRSEKGIDRSIEYYEKALEIDSNYALAYAGLANSYCTLGWAYRDPNRVFPKARDAAEKALEIDPNLAEAYPSLGWVRAAYDWDFDGAEQAFQQAIELNPRDPHAHSWRAFHLFSTGRTDEALASALRARQLDPGSLIISSVVGLCYFVDRDFEAARVELERVRGIDPNFFPALQMLGDVYIQLERYDDAIGIFEQLYAISGRVPANCSGLGVALASAGRQADARNEIRLLQETARLRYIPNSSFALIHGALGESDQAFAYLELAFQQRDRFLAYLAVSPVFDELREDPRFDKLVRRIRLRSVNVKN